MSYTNFRRIVYYAYLKKRHSHKSDWEDIVMRFTEVGKTDTCVHESVIMERSMLSLCCEATY